MARESCATPGLLVVIAVAGKAFAASILKPHLTGTMPCALELIEGASGFGRTRLRQGP